MTPHSPSARDADLALAAEIAAKRIAPIVILTALTRIIIIIAAIIVIGIARVCCHHSRPCMGDCENHRYRLYDDDDNDDQYEFR